MLANPSPENGRAVITQGFNVCSRVLMSVIFMDTRTAIPAQLVLLVAETGVHAIQHTLSESVLFAWMQTLVSSSIIAFSCVLEFWVTSHISALLDTESMVSSFRRMLRGASDGEVLLTEDMTVCEDTDCLKHLLMTQGNFKGKNFERLLVPEQVGRFRDFLKQSTAEAEKPEDQRTKTPPCLRLTLRGASDIRVGVDLWHVLMPRKDGMIHLLALREDSEAKATVPDAVNATSHGIQKLQRHDDSFRGSSESSSQSQQSSTSLLQNFPELSEMTLCVDANTHWFDVEQAHLSFLRQPQSSDSSMPSLRRLVRPTDWETVRSKLKTLPESLEMRLRLVDDSKKSMVAQVQVSRYRPPGRSEEDGLKLCLQFTDIVRDGSKSPSRRERNLAAINE